MIPVGVARTAPHYGETRPPYPPDRAYPELGAFSADAGTRANPAYAGVRAALLALGLDAEHAASERWNPLSALVARGAHVVLKPNFIRHWNPQQGADVVSVVTHGAVLRAVADYAFLAVGPEGRVTLAEAPQQDCSFEAMRAVAGLDALVDHYRAAHGRELGVIDLRREEVTTRDGVIVGRRPLPGDPAGYRVVDLGSRSFFAGSGLDPLRFRGADYDPGPTAEHHMDGRNEYLLSETVLSADLVVNLPKLKTHKKTGVTLALKNLVGINGDKNWLPHHCLGSTEDGGDEFPGNNAVDRWRSHATEIARRWLHKGAGVRFFRFARRLESATRGDAFIRSGNWHGNDTTWRMCLDLNRCLYYSDAKGAHLEADGPVRTVLTLMDAIVAGEGEGPLAPTDRPLGLILAATDPVALDVVAVRVMGFDETRIPKIRGAMDDAGLRITAVRSAADVAPVWADSENFESGARTLDAIPCERPFEPHPGWRGQIERESA